MSTFPSNINWNTSLVFSADLVAGMIIVLNSCFITLKFQKHNLPFTYNFHMYMVRSMEDEFHGIVGIRYAFIKNSEFI